MAVLFENYGIPPGTYSGVKYKVDLSLNHTLPFGHQVTDWWDFTANTSDAFLNDLFSPVLTNGFLITDPTGEPVTAPIGGNTVNIQKTVYTYLLQTQDGQSYWYPTSPNDLKYSISVHVEKQPDANVSENNFLNFKLYPNPSYDVINIDVDNFKLSDSDLVLTDLTGKSVLDNCNIIFDMEKNQLQIDIHSLNNGIYYCTLVIGGKTKTIPFVKM